MPIFAVRFMASDALLRMYMAKSAEKIMTDPQIGKVVFRKSLRSRSMRISVHPVRGVSVSVPHYVPYAAARLFFEARREWILETMQKQKERLKDVRLSTPEEIESMRRQAKVELPSRLAELASRYGFRYNRVTIKHNSSNWGSCSTKSNINLNLSIVRLPGVLQDYVLLHELCHLRHHDHSHAFHLLLEHVLTDHVLKEADKGDALSKELARKAAMSKARFPLDHTMTRAIREYRVL